jgi:FKBP-type peptidyl-prolyl cis-trans isomerase FklB
MATDKTDQCFLLCLQKNWNMIKNELDRVSYCFGITIAQNMKQQGMSAMNAELLAKGLDDYMKSAKLMIPEDEVPIVLQNYFKQLQEKQFEGNIAQGKEFLLENSKRKGVVSLPSGLQYESLKEGNGPKPKATDHVTTHYHGTLIDGTVFDSSVNRGEPATFPVNGVIKGWVETLQLMNVGSKWRIYVPENLAYGASPHPGGPIEPYSTLIFDIELISIQ